MKWDLRKCSWAESPTSTAFLQFRSLRWKNNRNRSPFERLYTKSNCWSLHRSYSGETIMVNSHNFGRTIPAMKSWPRLWILFAQIKQFLKIPQRRPRSMIESFDEHIFICGTPCGMNKSKVAAISLSTKPQRSPASRTSGCATWWRNAWCLTTSPVHVTMTMSDYA